MLLVLDRTPWSLLRRDRLHVGIPLPGDRLRITEREARTSFAIAGSNLAMKPGTCVAGESVFIGVDLLRTS